MDDSKQDVLETNRVLKSSLYIDLGNLILCTVAAIITGSAIVLVAALQSFAELSTEGLLIYGRKYVNKRPTKLHPFGFGKELYYWLTLAVFVLVAFVAVAAIQRGYSQLLSPKDLHHPLIGVGILALSVVANLYSLRASIMRMLEGQPIKNVIKVFNTSPAIAAKTTAVMDVMAVTVTAVGVIGLLLFSIAGSVPQIDGVGAVIMGLVLVFFAVVVPLSVRTFVTGQSAPPETERRIRDAARTIPEVRHVLGLRTMVLSSDKLMVDIDVHLRDGLSTDQVEAAIERVKQAIEATGDGMRVHVEPDAYVDALKD